MFVVVNIIFEFYRRFDVNLFGLWINFLFKVFVKNVINVKELKDVLIMLNKIFF